MKKYDFQKPSKIPYLETTGMPTRILLRKRRFKCYQCSKMAVAETSIVKKNHQIPRIINQKIAQKLIEKTSMTDIAISCLFQLQLLFASSMTSGLSMIFLAFLRLCLGMNMPSPRERWALLRKILKSSLSSLFLKVEHKLSSEITFFDRAIRCQVKIITIDMFSPYYDLAKQIHFRISRFRLKQSPRLFHSRILKSF